MNSIGVLGGLPGPVAIGAIKDATGSVDWGLLAPTAACLVAACLLAMATAPLGANLRTTPGRPDSLPRAG